MLGVNGQMAVCAAAEWPPVNTNIIKSPQIVRGTLTAIYIKPALRLHDGLGTCEWPRWRPLMMHTIKNVFIKLGLPIERQHATLRFALLPVMWYFERLEGVT